MPARSETNGILKSLWALKLTDVRNVSSESLWPQLLWFLWWDHSCCSVIYSQAWSLSTQCSQLTSSFHLLSTPLCIPILSLMKTTICQTFLLILSLTKACWTDQSLQQTGQLHIWSMKTLTHSSVSLISRLGSTATTQTWLKLFGWSLNRFKTAKPMTSQTVYGD